MASAVSLKVNNIPTYHSHLYHCNLGHTSMAFLLHLSCTSIVLLSYFCRTSIILMFDYFYEYCSNMLGFSTLLGSRPNVISTLSGASIIEEPHYSWYCNVLKDSLGCQSC